AGPGGAAGADLRPKLPRRPGRVPLPVCAAGAGGGVRSGRGRGAVGGGGLPPRGGLGRAGPARGPGRRGRGRGGAAARRAAGGRGWRRERHLPRWVCLAEGDNELPLDLDSPSGVALLLDGLRGRDEVVLVELFPDPTRLCARGPDGRYVHELVVPFVRRADA